MDISRLRNLISEYKYNQKKLGEIKGNYERTKISYEIGIDLGKELDDEIRMAKETNNETLIKYWQEIASEYYAKDKELSKKDDFEKAEKEILLKNQKLISYCEKKLKVIRKQLGARLTQLIDNYEERNILMGEEYSSKKAANIIFEEDEEQADKREKERRNSATFDKM